VWVSHDDDDDDLQDSKPRIPLAKAALMQGLGRLNPGSHNNASDCITGYMLYRSD
jgi:hypothetical protein